MIQYLCLAEDTEEKVDEEELENVLEVSLGNSSESGSAESSSGREKEKKQKKKKAGKKKGKSPKKVKAKAKGKAKAAPKKTNPSAQEFIHDHAVRMPNPNVYMFN